jgi:hypothetical protein
MTPQERQLVTELFDRLTRLAPAPRDAEAERAIADGLARAPDALYPLVQTVLVQDEALKRADARIRELSGGDANAAAGGGFLDGMRSALNGRSATSVPSVRATSTSEPDSRWNSGAAMAPSAQTAAPYAAPPPQGGSFLGTAAATAAGVIGGSLLFNALGGMFGHRSGSAFGDVPPPASPSGSPWDHNAAGSDLARDAGLNDVGGGDLADSRSAGLFDSDADAAGLGSDIGGDFGSDFGGGDSA